MHTKLQILEVATFDDDLMAISSLMIVILQLPNRYIGYPMNRSSPSDINTILELLEMQKSIDKKCWLNQSSAESVGSFENWVNLSFCVSEMHPL